MAERIEGSERHAATAAVRCADHVAALLAGRPQGVPVVGV